MSMSDEATALHRAYADHAGALLRLAVLATGDRAAAEDILHDAFVRWHRAEPAPAPGAERAYLRRTVLNLASNHHRWRRRHGDDRLPVAGPGPGADAVAMDAAVAARVARAVRGLPHRQRDCVLLFHFEGLCVEEVADALGISAGSVKTHLHRARTSLRPALEDLR